MFRARGGHVRRIGPGEDRPADQHDGALFSKKWSTPISRRLVRAEQTMREDRRDELRRLRELTQAITRLEREITELVGQLAAAGQRAGVRAADRGQARRRDRRRPAL